MLRTILKIYDIFKSHYWHGATLVGKYRLPQLSAAQAVPCDVIVCGRHITGLEKYDNIYYYPCFSQRWKERVG